MKVVFYVFILQLVVIVKSEYKEFCNSTISNIDESTIPKFPNEFETRVLMINSRKEASDFLMLYDSFKQRAEIILEQNGIQFRRVYYFDKNEFFLVSVSQGTTMCNVEKLSDIKDGFFNLVNTVHSLSMNPSNEVFHFHNEFPMRKLESTTRRGIPVDHYQSCQTWNGNFLVDHYFQSANFTQGIIFDNTYKQVIVEMDIEGYTNENDESVHFNNLYSFYEFKSVIEHRENLFTEPPGVFCNGQTNKGNGLPKFSNFMTFYTQEVLSNGNSILEKFFYNNGVNAVRFDQAKNTDDNPFNYPIKRVFDFHSGVGYVINKELGNCSFSPIGSSGFNAEHLVKYGDTQYGKLVNIATSNEALYIDNSSYFAGQRYERGILCDVYVSNRQIMGDNIVVEVFVRSGLASKTTQIPISVHFTNSTSPTQVHHFFNYDQDFNSVLEEQFEYTQCFSGKDRIDFGLRFTYADSFFEYQTLEEFESDKQLLKFFEQLINQAYSPLDNASPLRVVTPKIFGDDKGFTVYSGLTSSAPPIHHFKKETVKSKLDFNLAKNKRFVSSPEKCASSCLLDEGIEKLADNADFKCMSFDYCKMPDDPSSYMCVFNDRSVDADKDLVKEVTGTECEHYSKVVESFDAASVDTLFRVLEAKVIGEFEIFFTTNANKKIRFPKINIFKASQMDYLNGNLQDSNELNQFANEFYSNSSYDFRQRDGFIPKERIGVNLDECSRLCIEERSFKCNTLTFQSSFKACKWAELEAIDENRFRQYFSSQKGTNLFRKNLLSDYQKFEFQVTTSTDYKVVEVSTDQQCAQLCNNEKDFACRSFNLCQYKYGYFRCLLSKTSVHKNTQVTSTDTCSHYSKKPLSEFETILKTELKQAPKSQLLNVSVETCAEQCVMEDSYLCRSFNYYSNSGMCSLFTENIVDKINSQIDLSPNEYSTHYSRQFYEKDGQIIKVEALTNNSQIFYTGDTIFGVVLSLTIAAFILGILGAFAYLKVTSERKEITLPQMKFVNPNYTRQIDEIDVSFE